MNGLTVACVLAAWTVLALTLAGALARRGWRREQLLHNTHQRAETAREIDDLELIPLPADDPAWDAELERLWGATRDNHTNQQGDQS